MDPIPLLVVTDGPLLGGRYPVTDKGLMLGRDDTCDVVIDDTDVSRQHARVVLHNGSVWVQDAGSRNGVFVNDKRVTRHKSLSPGDRLTFGVHGFTLDMAEPFPDETSVSLSAAQNSDERPPWLVAVVLAVLSVLGAALFLAMG